MILSGPIVDVKEMEYYNVVSFKTREAVARALDLDCYSYEEEIKVFKGISRLLYEHLTWFGFAKVFLVFFFRNNWHKFFVKRLFLKVGQP